MVAIEQNQHTQIESGKNMNNLEETNDVVEDSKQDLQEGAQKKAQEKKKAVIREVISWIMVFVCAFLFAFVVNNFILINARIPSESMEKTIHVGDKVLGNRLSYVFSDVKRGDIVIFWSPVDENKRYIKRVIGLPGDTITIDNNVLFVNGEAVEEDYLNGWTINPGKYYYNPEYRCIAEYNGDDGFHISDYKIPDGEYFMMGDNRDNSSDSRYWGTIKKKAIIAKAIVRWSPSFKKLK